MPTVNYAITATTDDITELPSLAGLFPPYGQLDTGVGAGYDTTPANGAYYLGLRFLAVAVPNAAIITSATLTLKRTASAATGSGWGRINGIDVDDCPVLQSQAISGLATTAASTAIIDSGPNAVEVYSVTSIIQEIVNRAGWASGADLGFVGVPPGSGDRVIEWVDYGTTPADAAALSITYSAATYTLAANPGSYAVTGTRVQLNTPIARVFAIGTAISGTGTVSVAWPANNQVGDLGVLVIEQSGTDTTLTPSGWAHVSGSPVVDVASTAGSKLSVLTKLATTDSESSVATGDGGDHQIARIIVIRDPNQTTPISVAATGIKGTASTTATFVAVTTTADNQVVLFVASRPNDSSSTTSFGAPGGGSGLTSLVEQGEAGTTSGNGGGFVIESARKTVAGSTGTPTATAPSTTNAYITIGIASRGGGGFTIVANPGSYSLTGTAANTIVARRIAADAGSYAVTGTAANINRGFRLDAAGGTYALTGAAADFVASRRIAADGGTYALTGTNANIGRAYVLGADGGVYAVTGTDANLALARVLGADGGSYIITGTAADLRAARTLAADGGTYVLTGTDAVLSRSYALTADGGVYSLTGADAGLRVSRRLVADGGAYTLTGTAATLVYTPVVGYTIIAESGSYVVNGTDAGLRFNRRLVADPGSYVVTGTDANLSRERRLIADPGSYSLTGSPVTFKYDRVLSADEGFYALNGSDASLTVNFAPRPIFVVRAQSIIGAGWGNITIAATDDETRQVIAQSIIGAGSGAITVAATDKVIQTVSAQSIRKLP